MFDGVYRQRKVMITGVTGFKGSWLALWLLREGAEVAGYALPPPTEPSHYRLLGLDVALTEGDVRDPERLKKIFHQVKPEIVFHLAAQPLVRQSYVEPAETFATNVQGTVNVLEAARTVDSVRAVIVITSDKCYENREWLWGYRESDPLGGYDPYSASKAAAEIATASWRRSFFHPADYGRKHHTLVASVRAGNVIGGGDWAADRLVPDLMKAAAAGCPATVRNPASVRPWQHVLEPLCGYLQLGAGLLNGRSEWAEAWNFGPDDQSAVTVAQAAEKLARSWPKVAIQTPSQTDGAPHEAGLLKLDSSRARTLLGWRPRWNADQTFAMTASWYRDYYENGRIHSSADLDAYEQDEQPRAEG